MNELRIGISGWRYAGWRGDFYPKGLAQRRLRNIETALANFFASGVLALEEKLGPILWQFPASLPFDERIGAFLEALPRDTLAAAKLGR